MTLGIVVSEHSVLRVKVHIFSGWHSRLAFVSLYRGIGDIIKCCQADGV